MKSLTVIPATKATPGKHVVNAAYVGPLFQRPDATEISISVAKRGSRWAVRTDDLRTRIHAFRGGYRTKRIAITAADAPAAEITRTNESVRAALTKAQGDV